VCALCSRASAVRRARGFVEPEQLGLAVAELAPLLARVDVVDGNGRLTMGHLRARATCPVRARRSRRSAACGSRQRTARSRTMRA
jgi:hypothetical protein